MHEFSVIWPRRESISISRQPKQFFLTPIQPPHQIREEKNQLKQRAKHQRSSFVANSHCGKEKGEENKSRPVGKWAWLPRGNWSNCISVIASLSFSLTCSKSFPVPHAQAVPHFLAINSFHVSGPCFTFCKWMAQRPRDSTKGGDVSTWY